MPSNEPAVQPAVNTSTHQIYCVLASELTTHDSPGTLHQCQTVLVSAQDEHEALELARDALEEGFAPCAAFGHDDLLALAQTLASRPLKPGESYNLNHGMSGAEMTAQRTEDQDDEPSRSLQAELAGYGNDAPF